MDYERIVASTVPARQRFVQLWAGESSYTDGFGKHAQLPEAFLIDKNGKVVERYVGRIPAETGDRIASSTATVGCHDGLLWLDRYQLAAPASRAIA